mmetsp:Transcript_92627/g.299579  ORF Transcript_92627/g.299579 Transcript_92627/m.299579 type:complete len:220 (+) Transcript_92627:3968-4627(+)
MPCRRGRSRPMRPCTTWTICVSSTWATASGATPITCCARSTRRARPSCWAMMVGPSGPPRVCRSRWAARASRATTTPWSWATSAISRCVETLASMKCVSRAACRMRRSSWPRNRTSRFPPTSRRRSSSACRPAQGRTTRISLKRAAAPGGWPSWQMIRRREVATACSRGGSAASAPCSAARMRREKRTTLLSPKATQKARVCQQSTSLAWPAATSTRSC